MLLKDNITLSMSRNLNFVGQIVQMFFFELIFANQIFLFGF